MSRNRRDGLWEKIKSKTRGTPPPPLLTPEGRRFRNRINALSLEEIPVDTLFTAPENSPSEPPTPESDHTAEGNNPSEQRDNDSTRGSQVTGPEERLTATDEQGFEGAPTDTPRNNPVEQKNSRDCQADIRISNSVLRLRSGNEYRRRIHSYPDCSNHLELPGESRNSHLLTLEFKSFNTNKSKSVENKTSDSCKEKSVKMDYDKVSQLVHRHLPLLTGETGPALQTEVKMFLMCCEQVWECLTLPEDRTLFLRLLATRFRGRAFLTLSGSSYSTLEEFKKLVEGKLTGSKSYTVLLDELRQMRQLPGESLSSFSNRLKLIFESCQKQARERHPEHAEAVLADLEETAVLAFKSGILDPNFQFHFLQDAENQLLSLISKAERMEEAQRQIFSQSCQRFQYTTGYSRDTDYIPNNQHSNNLHFSPPSSHFVPTTASNITHGTTMQRENREYQADFPSYRVKNGYVPAWEKKHSQYYIETPFNNPSHVFSRQRNYNLQPSAPNPSLYRERGNSSPKIHPRIPTPVKCEFCGRAGHSFEECRTRKNTPYCSHCRQYGHTPATCRQGGRANVTMVAENTGIPKESTTGKNLRRRKCDFCLRFGHSAEECRARQNWEAKLLQSQPQHLEKN